MNKTFIDFFRNCIVKIDTPEESGTGFFVAPGLILTCAHVVNSVKNDPVNVTIVHGNVNLEIIKIDALDLTFPDLSLIYTSYEKHLCVFFDSDVQISDILYTYGYTERHKGGESATATYEGPAHLDEEKWFLKFKEGQIKPGFSGSPILNTRTFKVCGIVKTSRDTLSDLGGGGLPIATIFNSFPEILKLNKTFHQLNKSWEKHVNLKSTENKFSKKLLKTPKKSSISFKLLLKNHSLLQRASVQLDLDAETAILSSKIPPEDISFFLLHIAKNNTNTQFYAISYLALKLIDKHNIGHDVFDYCVSKGKLQHWERDSISMNLQFMTNEDSINWAHRQLINKFKNDTYYNSFIQKHLNIICNSQFDEMLEYLLYPDRGPDFYNVDTFSFIIDRLESTTPYQQRWIKWIHEGRFDGYLSDGDTSAELLYKILNNYSASSKQSHINIINEVHKHVYHLLKFSNNVNQGLYHLIAMVNAKYVLANTVKSEILNRVYMDNYSLNQRLLFKKLEEAFEILVECLATSQADLSSPKLTQCIFELYEMDNITGFWNKKR